VSLTHYATPNIKIRCDPAGADDALQSYLMNGSISMRENAVDIATLVLADENRTLYDNTVAFGDVVCIYVNYAEVDATLDNDDLRFYGFVEDMSPTISTAGEILTVKLRSYGRCLTDQVVLEEYGTESRNPTLDEFHEILQNATEGIIPEHVNDLYNTGTSSGYSIDSTLIEEDTDTIRYVYFPGVTAIYALHELQDIYQALQGSGTAGWHWIVRTVESPADTFTNYFCLTQVGNHSSGPPNVAGTWPTWWDTNQASSTIVVKQDMLTSGFTKRRAQANLVHYYGRLFKPGDRDMWTEYTLVDGAGNDKGADQWDATSANVTANDDNTVTDQVIGDYSVRFDISGADTDVQVPSGKAENWDIASWGGDHIIPVLDFWVKYDDMPGVGDVTVVDLHTGAGQWFRRRLADNGGNYWITAADEWTHIRWEVGPNAPTDDYAAGAMKYGWGNSGTADWADIDYIDIDFGDDTTSIWFDGLHFEGWIHRVARKTGESYYKQWWIVDDVGLDDSGLAATDTYPMAQYAYAELIRRARRPVQGGITLPGKPTILAGQKAHIHAAKYSGGFRIDDDFRITTHRLDFTSTGMSSYLELTDDLINGVPMMLDTPYSRSLRAVNPDLPRNRGGATIARRSVDITVPILEKTYAFNDFY
jgi:hypothetical protein